MCRTEENSVCSPGGLCDEEREIGRGFRTPGTIVQVSLLY